MPTMEPLNSYEFEGDNESKWKDVFIQPLRKIQMSVISNINSNLETRDDALLYVFSLILKLLKKLISPSPRLITVKEVEERVTHIIPSPADSFALNRARSVINDLFGPVAGKKKKDKNLLNSTSLISFPIQDVHKLFVNEVFSQKIDTQVTAFLLTILEWVAADIFKLSGNYVNNCRQKHISSMDIRIAMNADHVLTSLFYSDEEQSTDANDTDKLYFGRTMLAGGSGNSNGGATNANSTADQSGADATKPTYDEVVRDLIHEEQQFIKDLNLIIKVFREPFVQLLIKNEESNSQTSSLPSSPTSLTTPTNSGQWSVPSSPTHKTPTMITKEDIEKIFYNIVEIAELSVNFLCSLEDALEATADEAAADQHFSSSTTSVNRSTAESIGACFLEMAEAQEFDTFNEFAEHVLATEKGPSPSQEKLNALLQDHQLVTSLKTRGSDFFLLVKYLLPKLLNGVAYHCFMYFDYVSNLKELALPQSQDKENFRQAEVCLMPLKKHMKDLTASQPPKFGENYLRLYISPETKRCHSAQAYRKLQAMEGFDQAQFLPHCNEFIYDGLLGKLSVGKRDTRRSDRHGFLFESVLQLCKTTKRSSSIVPGALGTHHPDQLKPKERFLMRNIEQLIDHPDPSQSITVGGSNCQAGDYATLISNFNNTGINSSNSIVGEDFSSSQQSLLPYEAQQLAATLRANRAASLISTHAWPSTTSLASVLTVTSSSGNSTANTVTLPNSFEIVARNQQSIVLFAPTTAEKQCWMASLLLYSKKSMLERQLDSIISDEEKKNPLKLPLPSAYRFAEPDSEANIVFEVDKLGGKAVPLIRGATVLKLIERLTFHQHPDPLFVKIFLTTYRSFLTPAELLSLLIERFEIPDIDSTSREDKDRFNKKYSQPIKMRVLNVLKRWVQEHYYDFEKEPKLLEKLENFLKKHNTVRTKKWVDPMLNAIARKRDFSSKNSAPEVFTFDGMPPEIEWFLTRDPTEFNLLTLHPIEFARQLTLLEFDLFKKVRPCELVGCAWTKKEKEETSPNLLRMIKFSNNFTFYLEKSILDLDNFEERIALTSRLLEILLVLKSLNNFNGMLEIVSALNSAAVHRLEHTKASWKPALARAFEEASELNQDHNRKYQEQLRSINPPCVPFLGMYLTHIIHIEDGNPDDIQVNGSDSKLINFSKRRKVAEITNEIQQYQNQPYCLNIEYNIRNYLDSLSPLDDFNNDEKKFQDYLYTKSLEIEPRGAPGPNKFPRKFPEITLKSPGIKPPSGMTTLGRSKGFGFGSSAGATNHHHHNSTSSNQMSPSGGSGSLPNSPCTPITPPLSAAGSQSDQAVFAPVYIGGGNQVVTGSFSNPNFGITYPCNLPPLASGAPVSPAFTPPTPSQQSSSIPVGSPSTGTSNGALSSHPPPPPLPPKPGNHQYGRRPHMVSGGNSNSMSSALASAGHGGSGQLDSLREDSTPPPLPPRGIAPSAPRSHAVFQRSMSHQTMTYEPAAHHPLNSPGASTSSNTNHTPPSLPSPAHHQHQLTRRSSTLDSSQFNSPPFELEPPPLTPRRALPERRHSQQNSNVAPMSLPVHAPPPPPTAATAPASSAPSGSSMPDLIPELPPRTYPKPTAPTVSNR